MRQLVALLVFVAGCSSGLAGETTQTTEQTVATTARDEAESRWDLVEPFVGFSLSPRAFDENGLADFYDSARELGSAVVWIGPWQDLGEGGRWATTMTGEHDLVPVVVTGFPTEEGARSVPEDSSQLVSEVVGFLEENPVPYLGVGVETNTFLRENSVAEFEQYVALFADVAAAVHEVAPGTKVFPGFQLERLRGLRGGLFGDEPTDPEWDLLDRFPAADAIGFSTYPGLVFTNPDEMPDDYYSTILEHVDKPVVFTEVGWQAGGDLANWSGTPEKQAAYVNARAPELVEVGSMVIWSFLWDQEAPPAFETMGLVSGSDDERPALQVWRELFGD